jgi:hypothetical protein
VTVGIRLLSELSRVGVKMLNEAPRSHLSVGRIGPHGAKTLRALEVRCWVEHVGRYLRWHPDAAGVIWCPGCKSARWLFCFECNQLPLPGFNESEARE